MQQLNLASGNAALYYPPKKKSNSAVLVVPGMGENFHSMHSLQELLSQDHHVLAINLPGHHLNNNHEFSFGASSQGVRDAIIHIRHQISCKDIAIVAQSGGCTASIFALAGYDQQTEQDLLKAWSYLMRALNEQDYNDKNLAQAYVQLSTMLLESIKRQSRVKLGVEKLVLLAPVPSMGDAFVASSLLAKIPNSILDRAGQFVIHKPLMQGIKKQGNRVDHIEGSRPGQWKHLDMRGFGWLLKYLRESKEPVDFIKLLQAFASSQHERQHNLIKYFLRNYLEKPKKLIIHGKYDHFLNPLIKNQTALADFYRSLGNAQIINGDYSHIFNQKAWDIYSDRIVEHSEIMKIIQKYLRN